MKTVEEMTNEEIKGIITELKITLKRREQKDLSDSIHELNKVMQNIKNKGFRFRTKEGETIQYAEELEGEIVFVLDTSYMV